MSVAMVGAEPRPVRIEAHVGRPIESFTLVGLPDTSVREAKQRVRAAILSSGQELPHRQITVNLSPADLPKAGSDYDLPIALGVLAASKVIPSPSRMIVAGELALDGTVRRSRWAIGAALLAVERGWPCLVSEADAPTAARVTRRVPCSACGLSKRHLFDEAARRGGYDVVVTGPERVLTVALHRPEGDRPGPIVAHLVARGERTGRGQLTLRGREREDFVAGRTSVRLYTDRLPLGSTPARLVLP